MSRVISEVGFGKLSMLSEKTWVAPVSGVNHMRAVVCSDGGLTSCPMYHVRCKLQLEGCPFCLLMLAGYGLPHVDGRCAGVGESSAPRLRKSEESPSVGNSGHERADNRGEPFNFISCDISLSISLQGPTQCCCLVRPMVESVQGRTIVARTKQNNA